MKQILIVQADTNDGDYIHNISEVDEETLPVIRKAAKAIKNASKRHNWGTSEYVDSNEHPSVLYKDILSQEELEIFGDFVPSGEYGIHTINSIQLLTIEKEENLV